MTRREMARLRHKRNRRIMAVCVVVALAAPIITLLACSTQEPKEVLPTVHKAATAAPLAHTGTLTAAPSVTPIQTPATTPEPPETPQNPWTEEEIAAIARTLSGECYNDKPEDKRRVAEVIVNRVSNGGFGKTIIDVIAAPNQFCGYWNPSREISENDIVIATETLRDWYANDCCALSEWLFFTAGENRENVFRTKY